MHESVEVAAKKADLYRDLGNLLDNDLHTLAEEGHDLSGGQKQRINMARGFYKNAPYLLLDDCFSALDAVTVNTILETLHTVNAQTILCISQRLEVIEKADKILVFDEGRIVEEGTHEELLAVADQYCKDALAALDAVRDFPGKEFLVMAVENLADRKV